MIHLIYGEGFLRSIKHLPEKTAAKLTDLLTVLGNNPYHSLLHTKKLSGDLAGSFSFRITRDWRVIFQFIDTRTIKLIRVKHRKDIYRH